MRWCLAWLALGPPLLAGCGANANYTLQLVPRVPINQSPFDGGPTVRVRLLDAEGNTSWEHLGPLESGTVESGGFGPLDGTRVGIALGGDSGGANVDPEEIIAWGQSAPQSLALGGEEAEVEVLVAETGGVGTLGQLDDRASGAAAAVSRDGAVYLFGGTAAARGACATTIQKLDRLDGGDWTFRELDITLPVGVCHAVATPIDVDGRELIVLSGGEPELGKFDGHTNQVVVLDPATDELVHTDSLTLSFARHQAFPLPEGRVLLLGANQPTGQPPQTAQFELFDAAALESLDYGSLETTSGLTIFPFGFMASRLGPGVAVCGGATWVNRDVTPADGCLQVLADGTLRPLPSLPTPTRHGDMVTLADGRLLLAGGISSPSEAGPPVDATASAWVLDPEADDWETAGALVEPRAYHVMIADGDGGAQIIGGVGAGWDYQAAEDTPDCGETWVPGEGFQAHTTCGVSGTGLRPQVALGGPGAFLLQGVPDRGIGGEAFGVISIAPR